MKNPDVSVHQPEEIETPETHEQRELGRINGELVDLSRELGFESSSDSKLSPVLDAIQDDPHEGWFLYDGWMEKNRAILDASERETGVDAASIKVRVGMAILALLPHFRNNFDDYEANLEILIQYVDGLPRSPRTQHLALPNDARARIESLRLPESMRSI
jgi:hypothetical protein